MADKYYTYVKSYGENILCRYISNKKRSTIKDRSFKPELYIPTNKTTEFKTINGSNLERMEFLNKKDYYGFVNQYRDVEGFDIYGNIQLEYQYIANNFKGQLDFNINDIVICYLDIETESEFGFPNINNPNEKINVITCRIGKYRYTFALCNVDIDIDQEKEITKLYRFESENELLESFLDFWISQYPDIITGWSVRFFDVPYLYARLTKVLSAKQANSLSPWGLVSEGKIQNAMGERKIYSIAGISILDYYELYQTFTYVRRESYKLDYIAKVELNEKKLDYKKYGTIKQFYTKDMPEFVRYNIHDVRIVEKLESKLKLIELALALAYRAKINYEDVFSQVRIWDVLIYNTLKEKNIQVPPKKSVVKTKSYEGAYVKDPIIGLSNWVCSFDIASLYPNLIRQFNIGNETILESIPKDLVPLRSVTVDSLIERQHDTEPLKKYNVSMTANGQFFDNTKKSTLSSLMEILYNDRKLAQKKKFEYEKYQEKIKDELKKRGVKFEDY